MNTYNLIPIAPMDFFSREVICRVSAVLILSKGRGALWSRLEEKRTRGKDRGQREDRVTGGPATVERYSTGASNDTNILLI